MQADPIDALEDLEKAIREARGGKYYRRIPTGKPKRPWRYVYSKEEYNREKEQHVSGPEAQKHREESAPARVWISEKDATTKHGLPKSTKDAHQAGGSYSSERRSLHAKIVEKFLDDVKPVEKGKKPVAILTMGGPASGKTSLLKHIVGNYHDFVGVNPDDVKDELPEYQKAINLGKTKSGAPMSARNAAHMAHDESSDVAEEIQKQAIEGRKNVIIDGTGKNIDKYLKKIKVLKDQGYHVQIIMPHVTLGEALKRVSDRARKTGRYVPNEVSIDAHRAIPGNFEKIAHAADEYALFRAKKPPSLIVSGGKDRVEKIHDPKEHAAFMHIAKTAAHDVGAEKKHGAMYTRKSEEPERLSTDLPEAEPSFSLKDVRKRLATWNPLDEDEKKNHAPAHANWSDDEEPDDGVAEVVQDYEDETRKHLQMKDAQQVSKALRRMDHIDHLEVLSKGGAEQAGHKYLSRKPDGRGGYVYTYGQPHEHPEGHEPVKAKTKKISYAPHERLEGGGEGKGPEKEAHSMGGDFAIQRGKYGSYDVVHTPSGMIAAHSGSKSEGEAVLHHVSQHPEAQNLHFDPKGGEETKGSISKLHGVMQKFAYQGKDAYHLTPEARVQQEKEKSQKRHDDLHDQARRNGTKIDVHTQNRIHEHAGQHKSKYGSYPQNYDSSNNPKAVAEKVSQLDNRFAQAHDTQNQSRLSSGKKWYGAHPGDEHLAEAAKEIKSAKQRVGWGHYQEASERVKEAHKHLDKVAASPAHTEKSMDLIDALEPLVKGLSHKYVSRKRNASGGYDYVYSHPKTKEHHVIETSSAHAGEVRSREQGGQATSRGISYRRNSGTSDAGIKKLSPRDVIMGSHNHIDDDHVKSMHESAMRDTHQQHQKQAAKKIHDTTDSKSHFEGVRDVLSLMANGHEVPPEGVAKYLTHALKLKTPVTSERAREYLHNWAAVGGEDQYGRSLHHEQASGKFYVGERGRGGHVVDHPSNQKETAAKKSEDTVMTEEKLSKGLYDFKNYDPKKQGTIPDEYLWDYLCAFVEEAYEAERREKEHQNVLVPPASTGEDVISLYAGAVMRELVQYIPSNDCLKRAAKKFDVTKETIKGILSSEGFVKPYTTTGEWTDDYDSLAAMGGVGTTRPMQLSAKPDPLSLPVDGVALAKSIEPAKKGWIDDSRDPHIGLADAEALRIGAASFRAEAEWKPNVSSGCVIHGVADLTKAQNYATPHAHCTCPR